ncbi:MAG: sugar phosphate isomerase/epimerase [Phycisphaerae bacterium]|nr:sugar phosphate isomerase/epimerase [Phycisphaerae bacterium]
MQPRTVPTPPVVSRRSFLVHGAAAAAACATLPALSLARPATAPWRISLAQWSLHRALFEGTLDPLDFPKAARGYGIGGAEYVNAFYRDLAGDAWIAELRRRAEGEGVQSLLIMCDGEGMLGAPDAAERAEAVRRHERWLHVAAALGCHSIRVNAQSAGSPSEQERLLADGLAALADRAKPLNLNVIVENHGGQSSDGVWLANTLRAAQRPNVGALPDFGNFRRSERDWCDRYAGVAALMPLARAVSAKSYDFAPDGMETTIDYPRMLGIVKDAGYQGWIGIEYEGRRLGEADGIRATRRLLESLGCSAA